MIFFPIDPDTVQNGSEPDFDANIPDIVMLGHRRSLAEWLKICRKSYVEWLKLREQGFGVKQSLVYGLPFRPSPSPQCPSRLLFGDVAEYAPDKLSQLPLRVTRLSALIGKLTDMPNDLRREWSRRLLTSCYLSWCKRKPWRPSIAEWYPHFESIPLSREEQRDIGYWKELVPIFLEGNFSDGFTPTPRLLRHYAVKIAEQARGLIDWYPLISSCESFALDERVSVEKLCSAIGVHKFTLYRAFKTKGIDMAVGSSGHTFREWIELARLADNTRTHRRMKLGAGLNRR
jgi:hypothetical protein